jgi:hypothetical protein
MWPEKWAVVAVTALTGSIETVAGLGSRVVKVDAASLASAPPALETARRRW